ncbi:NAD(P)-binding protein [Gonapodya prolifera JEL478]|uniref:NAD(P)-binding protein n=1 Tax=Gonapodya prolifera (strain JEL478) TaxID=1344416 RepID=A0A139B0G6_GONPJ|nr:NAD(P)-binding protein [Gonapodya prolifera JEL478]|eukprot:KXS22488.1 NAD(P)-binding protein [Gonapodya prolifera JEL478]
MAVRFDGQAIVVTGSGRGIGRSHALFFAARGANVVINDTGAPTTRGDAHSQAESAQSVAEDTARYIQHHGGPTASFTTVSAEFGDAVVRESIDKFGRLDVLVVNAGILRSARLERMSEQAFDAMWKVNVKGAYSAVRAAWPVFLKQGYGRIVLTSSTSGTFGSFGGSNYGTSKYCLIGLLLSISSLINSLPGNPDISISAVCPFAFTRMGSTVMKEPPSPEGFSPDNVSPVVAMLASREYGGSCNGDVWLAGYGHYARMELEPAIHLPRVYQSGGGRSYTGVRFLVVGSGSKSPRELSSRLSSSGGKVIEVDVVDGKWNEASAVKDIDAVFGGELDVCLFDWSDAPLPSKYPLAKTFSGSLSDPDHASAVSDLESLHRAYLLPTLRIAQIAYARMRRKQQPFGRFVSFLRADIGREGARTDDGELVVGPEWNSAAYGIHALLQVLTVESRFFDFDISGHSVVLHPVQLGDAGGVRPGACLPVVADLLGGNGRGYSKMCIFNGTSLAWHASPGSFLSTPPPRDISPYPSPFSHFKIEETVAEVERGWEQAANIHANGSYWPKDEPEATAPATNYVNRWYARWFPSYSPSGIGVHGKKGKFDNAVVGKL